jgi:hypothetical protein
MTDKKDVLECNMHPSNSLPVKTTYLTQPTELIPEGRNLTCLQNILEPYKG